MRRTAGSVFSRPMQLGPISRHPAARTRSSSAASRSATVSVALAEPGADDADRPHVLRDAVVDRGQDLRRRHDHDREIDRSVDILDVRDRRGVRQSRLPTGAPARSGPVNPASRRFCRISEPIRPRWRLAPTTATTRGSKKRLHRLGGGGLRPRRGLLLEDRGRVEVDRHVVEPILHGGRHGESRIAEDVEHPAVVGHHVRVELGDAPFRGRGVPGVPAAACRCRAPAPRRRPRRRPRRAPARRRRDGSRRRRRSGHRPRAISADAAPSLDSISGRIRAGVNDGYPRNRKYRLIGDNACRKIAIASASLGSARRRQTVDPSRTTTSIVSAVLMKGSPSSR